MNSFRKSFLVFSLAAAGFAASASAAVLVETNGTAPDADVLFGVHPEKMDQSYAWSRVSMSQFGQSFTATSDAKMEKLTIQAGTLSATSAPFTLNIYQIASVNDGPLQVGTPIYTGTGNLPSSQGPKPGYMTFTLDAPITLSEGSVYLFTFDYQSTGAGSLGFYRGAGGVEADGSNFWASTDGGVTFTRSTVLLDVYIQGTAVPEPALGMLLLPAIAGAIFFRRR